MPTAFARAAYCFVASCCGLVRPGQAASAARVLVELDGSLSPDPAELQLFVGGSRAPVSSVTALAPGGWDVVVYLDAALSADAALRRAANAVAGDLDVLLRLGPVELVIADPLPRSLLPATRDAALLRPALARLELQGTGADLLRARRRAFLAGRPALLAGSAPAASGAEDRDPAAEGEEDEDDEDDAAPSPGAERDDPDPASEAARDEVELLRRHHDALLAWLGARGGVRGTPGGSSRGRVLLLASEGLAVDTLEFYAGRGARDLAPATREAPRLAALADAVLALGWVPVVAALPPPDPADDRRLRYQPNPDNPIGFRLKLGRAGDRRAAQDEAEEPLPDAALVADQAALDQLVADSGGMRWRAAGELGAFVERLRHSVAIEVAVEGAGALEIRSPRAVRAPRRLVPAGLPDSVSAARVRRVIEGEAASDAFTVEAELAFDPTLVGRAPARLVVEAGLEATHPARLTVASILEGGETVLQHQDLATAAAPAAGGAAPPHLHELPVNLPLGTTAVVVLVEAVDDPRLFGAADADLVEQLGGAGERALHPRAAARLVRLEPEDPLATRGRAVFRSRAGEGVVRVEFILDGKRIAARDAPPFEIRLDLGAADVLHEVLAVGYDADGFELDRDLLRINEPTGSFWVRIVEPRPGLQAGPVAVEASVRVPEGARLDRLRFFWRDRLVTELEQAPWKATVDVPLNAPDGYIRVEALLADGRSAEDVVLLNRPGFDSRLDVELVELYVVASDRQDRPVRELQRADFEVLEDGEPQELESWSAAGDLPLTVGLAIDTSSSLFMSMPEVAQAANDFVRSLVRGRDRAFLLQFGARPQMAQPTTGNLRALTDRISALAPYGTTPVWEAVAMALEQLEALAGRKALIVFYDGDDEDLDYSYARSLRLARRLRLPIYLIVVNDAAARTEGRSFKTRAFVERLERMARAGGGRVHYVVPGADLTSIFAAIGEELRSHYLLTYYPREPGGGPRWRTVAVKVKRPGISARTIEGYGKP